MLDRLLQTTKTSNLSVACFSLPGETTFTFWVQDTDSDKPGLNNAEFWIHPFFTCHTFPVIQIKPQWIVEEEADLPADLRVRILSTEDQYPEYWVSLIGYLPEATIKQDFLDRVNTVKNEITRANIEKAMLSAIRIMPKSEKKFSVILNDLRCNYPNAFIFYTSTPIHGTWIGATPEILLYQDGKKLETVSLAGTKTIEQQHEWGEKEKHEQELVTHYIREVLQGYPIDEIKIQGPDFYSVGQLVHLRTLFNISLQHLPDRGLINKLACDMHPTPAVGGYPKEQSLTLIREIERHERGYYAGFLGPVTPKSTSLFVNLRCASMFEKQVAFYSGAGITAGSNPEAEWEETEHKAVSVLQFFK